MALFDLRITATVGSFGFLPAPSRAPPAVNLDLKKIEEHRGKARNRNHEDKPCNQIGTHGNLR
jgi:hypothetical protein